MLFLDILALEHVWPRSLLVFLCRLTFDFVNGAPRRDDNVRRTLILFTIPRCVWAEMTMYCSAPLLVCFIFLLSMRVCLTNYECSFFFFSLMIVLYRPTGGHITDRNTPLVVFNNSVVANRRRTRPPQPNPHLFSLPFGFVYALVSNEFQMSVSD